MTDLSALDHAPRLLLEATLTPVQTDRFQPTGFPDLGAATYTLHDGTQMLLVESAQSMANRAEAACWDEATGTLVPVLAGLPYVHVDVSDGAGVFTTTSSVLEAHRLNSPYVLDGKLEGRRFEEVLLEKAGFKEGQPIERKDFLAAAFRYDPGSLLHGLFMSQVGDGRLRFARAMSSFIEARGVRVAQSGGVKNDRINASGEAEKGFGNVPFARTEYTAEKTTAFMNVDLRQLRSFGLKAEALKLLHLLAIYKFQKLLRDQLRLRTACDFEAKGMRVTAPEAFVLPSIDALERELPGAIAACKKFFAEPAVTNLVFTMTSAAGKASKKVTKAKAEAPKAEAPK
jgi:CRISPR-associated protein Csb1